MRCICNVALRGGLVAALGLTIAACGSSSAPKPPEPGGGITVRQEDQFGIKFGTAFRADNNSEPDSPADDEIVPIFPTTEPVEIK